MEVKSDLCEFVQKGKSWKFSKVNFIEFSSEFNYISPSYFWESDEKIKQASYWVVSAPGAIGKSAFAKNLAALKNAMVWDLSKLKLGSNTFIGSVVQAIGARDLPDFLASINQGETTLVFDAIDEAELHSGWNGVFDFIKDVVQYTSNTTAGSVIFLARKDSAELVEAALLQLISDEKKLTNASIGYFSKINAKKFVVSQINDRAYVERNSNVINQKIDEAFSLSIAGEKSSQEAVDWNSVEHEKFFGYAPVLQTIAKSLEEADNIYKLRFENSSEGYADVVSKIIDLILLRESDKFNSSLNQRFGDNHGYDFDNIYSPEDQLERIIWYTNHDENEAFKLPKNLPLHIVTQIDEMVKGFLPQHPFLESRNYAGPAFRDYSVAYGLVKDNLRIGSEMWLDSNQSLSSPILASLYHLLGAGRANPCDTELLYESVNSGSEGNKSNLFISEQGQDLLIEIVTDGNNPLGKSLEFVANKPEAINFSRRLTNARIFVPMEINLGKKDHSLDIVDCELVAKKINIYADSVAFRSTSDEIIYLESDLDISTSPTIKLNVNPEDKLSVVSPNSKIYPWSKYSAEANNQEKFDIDTTLHVMARILGWFRKDRRDEYGRYKDLIIKHVVGSSPTARYALGFIDHIGALSEDGTLYFIDTNKLDALEISWQKIRGGNVSDKARNAVGKYLANTPQPPNFQ